MTSSAIEAIYSGVRETAEVQESKGRGYNRKEILIPPNSIDLAWFLGVMAGDGSSTFRQGVNNTVRMNTTSPEFAAKFSLEGRKLFGVEGKTAHTALSTKNPNWNDVTHVVFYSKKMVEFFGDFHSEVWQETVGDSFAWIEERPEYIWAFLTGFFDSEGSISDPTIESDKRVTHRARFAVAYVKAAEYVMSLLEKVNVLAMIEKSASKREGISSVAIYGIEQISYLAKHIYSCIPKKERCLNLYRNAQIELNPSPEILEAYKLAMQYRQELGLSAGQIAKLPEMQRFQLPESTYRNWIYSGTVPQRKGNSYTSITFSE